MLRGVGGGSCEAPPYPDMRHFYNVVFDIRPINNKNATRSPDGIRPMLTSPKLEIHTGIPIDSFSFSLISEHFFL